MGAQNWYSSKYFPSYSPKFSFLVIYLFKVSKKNINALYFITFPKFPHVTDTRFVNETYNKGVMSIGRHGRDGSVSGLLDEYEHWKQHTWM